MSKHFLFATSAILFSIVLVGCQGDNTSETKEKENAPPEPIAVRTKNAEKRTLSQVITGLGSCEALLDKTATVAAAVEEHVEEILHKPGDKVEANTPLVQMHSRVAEANYQEKKRIREGAEASLRLLEVPPRFEEQKALQLEIDNAKHSVQKAESVVARLQSLRERNEISAQQMFEAELDLKQARVQQQKAEMALKVLLLPPKPEAVDQTKANIAAAAAAELSSREELNEYTIRSPISGIVDKITCHLGQVLSKGTLVAEIVDARQLYVLAYFPSADAKFIHPGQPVQIRSNDSPGNQKTVKNGADAINGQVVFVGQMVDPQTGNLPVRVLVDNSAGRLRLGEMVSLAITARQQPDALVVPFAAIVDLGEGPLLYVIRDGKANILYPQLGLWEKDWVEVVGIDLKPGEPVVIEGQYSLPDETPVHNQLEDAKR